MEKTMTVEEKVRRAEEIYERRRRDSTRPIATVNVREKKDIRLLKKMIIQLLVCTAIYLIIYSIQNNNYAFSEDFVNKTNEILSYNINFQEIYQNIKDSVNNFVNSQKNGESEHNQEETNNETNKETTSEENITGRNWRTRRTDRKSK